MNKRASKPVLTAGQSLQTLTVLTVLRVSLHVMFAFLLFFGAVAALLTAAPLSRHLLVSTLALALGCIYLWGTVFENRRGLPTNLRQVFSRPGAAAPQPATSGGPSLPVGLWLSCITGLWLALMLLSSSFTWVVFPIMFLYLHLLRPLQGVLATLALCAFAVALPLVGPAGFGLEQLRARGVAPGFFIGPLLGALLAIVISFTYRALREDAQRQFRLAEQLRAVQAQLVQQQYSAGKLEERERLAREIHDTLAQGLSSIVLVSRAAEGALAAGDAQRAAGQLSVISSSAAENLAEARRFIKDLASPALDDSLPAALARLAETTEATQRALGGQAGQFTCTFTFEGDAAAARRLPEPISVALIRCAQGALANTVAHAGASRSALTLSLWPEKVTLDVLDNGSGFDVLAPRPAPEPGDRTGFGLKSLAARAAALGGALEIESGKGGTTVTVTLPLPQQES